MTQILDPFDHLRALLNEVKECGVKAPWYKLALRELKHGVDIGYSSSDFMERMEDEEQARKSSWTSSLKD